MLWLYLHAPLYSDLFNYQTIIDMDGNKLPDEYENPIDLVIYKIINYMNPVLYKLGFTPNIITTISFILGIASMYTFLNKSYIMSGFLLFLSYYFDCADGNFARRYDMVTTFGDWYDHLTDLFVVIGLIILVARSSKINYVYKYAMLGIIFILLICTLLHLMHQEEYYRKTRNSKNESSMMDQYINAIFNIKTINVENLLNTKYTGCGTYYLVFSLLIAGITFV